MPRRRLDALPAAMAACLTSLLCACATTATSTDKLPFHVAIAAPIAVPDAAATTADGDATELVLAVDAQQLGDRLAATLAQTFLQVSRLPAPPAATPAADAAADLVARARELGADLILQTTVSYDPKIRTALNDRFWLNLPLFALGGPFGWFVADRSYFGYSRLEAQLFDVSAAAASQDRGLQSARVLRVDREATETSLSFLQRASGAGPYLLSLVCPAGLIARQSAAVPPELDAVVVEDLCQALARSLRDRAIEITETDLVDFHPRAVHTVRQDGQRFLVGEVVLGLTQANELGGLRYRAGSGPFVAADWLPAVFVPSSSGGNGQKVYPFRIPLDGAATGAIQLEVEQLDRFETKRTFTFALDETGS